MKDQKYNWRHQGETERLKITAKHSSSEIDYKVLKQYKNKVLKTGKKVRRQKFHSKEK